MTSKLTLRRLMSSTCSSSVSKAKKLLRNTQIHTHILSPYFLTVSHSHTRHSCHSHDIYNPNSHTIYTKSHTIYIWYPNSLWDVSCLLLNLWVKPRNCWEIHKYTHTYFPPTSWRFHIHTRVTHSHHLYNPNSHTIYTLSHTIYDIQNHSETSHVFHF